MSNKPKAKKKQGKKQSRPRVDVQHPPEPKTPWLKYLAWGGGVVVLVVLLALAFSGLAPTEEPDGIVDFAGLTREHTDQRVAYEQDPPVGGAHAPIWLNCGFYDVEVPNENAVHSLEHGAVWITYRPDLSADELERLRDFGQQSKVLVTPYPSLQDDVVASVWGRQLRVPQFNASLINDFIVTQKDGPGTPEPGALCSGGVGIPAS